MNEEQRLLLNAFNDDEADPAESARARQLIEADAEARAYWLELRRTDGLLRETFGPIAEQAIPARFDGVLGAARRRSSVHHYVPLALAATLALVAVLLVREDSMNSRMNEQLLQMRQEIASLKNQTLENIPSGSAGSWVAPAGLARAEVRPLQTYRTQDNRFCREYEERIEDADGVEIRRGIACRAGKGNWPDLTQSPGFDGAHPMRQGEPSIDL